MFEDYIVPPQENNALFLMTNFIRTDQEHKRCAGMFQMKIVFIQALILILEAPDEKESACTSDSQCQANKDFQKVGENYDLNIA